MTSSTKLAPKDKETLSQSGVHTDLSNAFQFISQVPLEDLLAHRLEALSALDKLHTIFSANGVPATSKASKSRSSLPALLRSLNQSQKGIKEYLSLSEACAVGESPEEKSKGPPGLNSNTANPACSSWNVKFRQGLSHRRWALDYERWELAKFDTSRINQLLQILTQNPIPRDGYVNRFVMENTHELQDREAVRKVIQHGIKMLIVERLCQKTAVSALLSFCTNSAL